MCVLMWITQAEQLLTFKPRFRVKLKANKNPATATTDRPGKPRCCDFTYMAKSQRFR